MFTLMELKALFSPDSVRTATAISKTSSPGGVPGMREVAHIRDGSSTSSPEASQPDDSAVSLTGGALLVGCEAAFLCINLTNINAIWRAFGGYSG